MSCVCREGRRCTRSNRRIETSMQSRHGVSSMVPHSTSPQSKTRSQQSQKCACFSTRMVFIISVSSVVRAVTEKYHTAHAAEHRVSKGYVSAHPRVLLIFLPWNLSLCRVSSSIGKPQVRYLHLRKTDLENLYPAGTIPRTAHAFA
jgi:hypothetical protein